MKRTLHVFSVICLSLLLTQANAQVPAPANAGYEGPNRLNTWAITVTPAITQFYGDLRQFDFKRGPEEHITGGLGIGIHKQITPIFGMSTNFWTGSLNGSKTRLYNAHFESKGFLQGSINAHMNLKPLLFGYQKLKRWKWDIHGGYGYMWFNTIVYRLGTSKGVELIRSNTKASSRTAGEWEHAGSTYTREIVFPVGTSFHYEVNPRLDLGLEFVLNNVNSEKVDMTAGGVTDYANQRRIWLFNKGDSKNDKWGSVGIGITYKLGKDAVMAKKDRNGNWISDPKAGRYHLRYTNPLDLVPPPFNPTMSMADSIAKSNMPAAIDPRFYTDSDGDGVSDLFDKEPGTAPNSVVSGAGVTMDLSKLLDCCKNQQPAPKTDECEAMFSNLDCADSKGNLSATSQNTLKQIADLMNMRPNCRVVLVGHSDIRGNDAANMKASKKMVDAAKKYLIASGMQDPSRILTEYYGNLKPMGTDPTKNCRVELKVLPMSDVRSMNSGGFRTGLLKEDAGAIYTGPDRSSTRSGAGGGCGSAAAVFASHGGATPKVVTRLGSNPEFGNVHGLSTDQFFKMLSDNYNADACDRSFLDGIARNLGYKSFADISASNITSVVVPKGSVGNLGYGRNHQSQFSQLEADPLDAFKIVGSNGKAVYFMKTCGNHFFPTK